jgi:hypothetical protein
MIQRYFLILTTRQTGSPWLAKLLNSHFEVMCFHELEFFTYTHSLPPQSRAFFEFAPEERLSNLLYLFSPSHRYADSYQVLGTITSGADLSVRRTMEAIAAYFPEAPAWTRCFVLMQNPVAQIHSHTDSLSRMAGSVTDAEQMRDFHRQRSRDIIDRMESALAQALFREIQCANGDAEYFLHACLEYQRLIWAAQEARSLLPYRSVLSLEDLSSGLPSLRQALHEITGLEYNLPLSPMEGVNRTRDGETAAALFRSWSPQRQSYFAQVFEPQRQTLESLGYPLL